MNLLRYGRWLHLRWPAGRVERLPLVAEDGTCAIPGITVVGDLTGVPLLKFACDSGAKAVARIAADPALPALREATRDEGVDIVIVGGGVAGMAAALEAARRDLTTCVIEASEPFSTIVNFPARKPIFTYPEAMQPAGVLQVAAEVKEELVEELREQSAAVPVRTGRAEQIERAGKLLAVVLAGGERVLGRRVVVAIGRSGEFRRLGVPGEELPKVYNRLHDPHDWAGQRVLVVGGGDSAVEAAVALAEAEAEVSLAHRGSGLTRPKPDNLARLAELRGEGQGRIAVRLGCDVRAIEAEAVMLCEAGTTTPLANDVVFTMLGREAPLPFLRRSGIPIAGDRGARFWVTLVAMLAACTALYRWKSYSWGPWQVQQLWNHLGGALAAAARDPHTLIGTVNVAMTDPGFYYTLAYSAIVVIFGIRRIRRRRTAYVTAQTLTLMAVQVVPLCVLPYIVLPYLGAHGAFTHGVGRWLGDALFPGGEYWRAFGLVLAWPLFVYNVFTAQPLWGWLVVSLIQTFVLIPLIVRKWGKGAYCGWICSCGALAETLGDTQRTKMPHGAAANRFNFIGQALLGLAFALFAWRVAGWLLPPGNLFARSFEPVWLHGVWKPVVDVTLAGILGVGLYFHFSGRVWCRFACPLAALMHIYARFSRFRIFADKKKCISCNLCTSVCHMGIDVMNFANKGEPMADPECVRCSACVQTCPTGVLSFGELKPEEEKR